jgi:hypothetical protein
MSKRRQIWSKRQERRSSRKGLYFCILLGAAVMLVPVGSDFALSTKAKARDMMLRSGMIDLNACVVTPAHAIACTSDAVGIPVQVALRRMQELESAAAAENKLRLRAEESVRVLAAQVEQLNERVTIAQDQLAEQTGHTFPSLTGAIKPTGFTGSAETADSTQADQDTAETAAEIAPVWYEPTGD